jgi:GT2 family glycosyltransferase
MNKEIRATDNFVASNCKVYIVILNYDGLYDTIECLESIMELDYLNYQVILIDNSETALSYDSLLNWASLKEIKFDKTTEGKFNLANHKNQFVFVKAEKNKGFAAGNNIALNAILKSHNEDYYIWLLNNDTVVSKDSLQYQLDYLIQNKESKIGILGSRLIYYYQRDKMQAVGGKFNKSFFISTHVGEGQSINTLKTELEEIDYVIGASMLVPYLFLKEVGVLCEDYFLYYEELDWAYQAKKKGWSIDWCSESLVFHKEGASIGSSYNPKHKSFFSEVNIFKSRKIFVKKHYKLGLRFYVSSLLLILNRARKGKFKLVKELLKITFDK